MNRPNTIFEGVLGSIFRLRKKAKKATTNGVRITTQAGFTD
jgi:hypothetical protein